MADRPDILKYFYEEPALLEPVTPDADPDARRRNDRHDLPDNVSMTLDDLLDTRDAYRGYLAGTNRTKDTVGVTTLQEPDVYAVPILEALCKAPGIGHRLVNVGEILVLTAGQRRKVRFGN